MCVSSEMKFICLTLLFVSGITDSRSEQTEVVGPADPVLAVAGEDVILPCSVKPSFSVVDMRVEWSRPDLEDSLVHLYEDHEDKNTDQIQSYRGRTKLNNQDLQRGNASLKLSSVQISDEGHYKCFIESKSWSDDATVNVKVEVVGSPPVITVDGFDRSGGLHLQCESEGWYPEPDLEWLDSEGVRLDSGTTETHRNTDGFSLKHTIIVYHSGKIHCRVKVKHHMLETLIDTSTQKKWTQDTSDWDGRDKPNGKSCSNMTQVLDNWKYAIMYQVKDMLVNDHASILPEYVRIQPLSDAVGDLYKQFNTLKENLAKLTNKFDKVESFVDEIQAGKFPKPKLWTPPRHSVRRIPVKSPARVPGKAVWAQRRARRGPET